MIIYKATCGPVVPALAARLGEFAADPRHHLACTPDLAAAIGFPTLARIALSGVDLLAAPVPGTAATRPSDDGGVAARDDAAGTGIDPKRAAKLSKSMGKVAELSLKLVQAQIPSAPLRTAIDGVEVVLAGAVATQAWLEVGQKGYVKPLLASSQTVVELLEALKPALPALDKIGPQLATISVVLKIADAVFQVVLDLREGQSKPSEK